MSRVGKATISLPEKVSVKISGGNVAVDGPKGKLELDLPEGLVVKEDSGELTVERASELRSLRALHGTFRSLINNMIQGVNEGYVKDLEIQGVGFRAAVKGKAIDLSLGKSHPILHPIPEGLTVTVADNTKIKVEGIDKQLVGQFAAEVRSYYPPEPYKGKGVRYVGEYVRRKAGKSVK
ncbi:50S ribosomal protein L6 [Akkermansiaceae bacterium]|nr:50S ribosomal protein L6 [Akkermansiaceae bacterium]MDC0265340.1 50S ribosomal protein L6 [bacterium]MDA7538666.1 50S ribosomal protein L6 [Akkermansiaceae bacterium]MDA7651023.1 50S ribosomal protein L6 [Akkermansiaceae bacterium]MDA7931614.1 50S ribosomal protein L6 [Akkermansiaceae bacterium]